MSIKLLYGGRMIPEFEPQAGAGVIDNGAAVIDGDRVTEVGNFETLKGHYPDAPVLGSNRHLLIPGLVNAHHHGYGVAGYRLGCVDDTLEVWVPDPLRRRPLDLYLDTLVSDSNLLRAGVTTVLHQGYARGGLPYKEAHGVALRGHVEAGIRVAYAVGHQDRNPVLYGDPAGFLDSLADEARAVLEPWLNEKQTAQPEDYIGLLESLCTEYQGHERIRILAGPEGPEWCTPALLDQVADTARELDIGIHIHVLESAIQRELSQRNGGENTVAALERLGLLRPSTSIAHAAWFNDDDMRRSAEHGVTVAHNPSSNLRLRNGIAPVSRMLSLGVNVALGCDSTSINSDDDLLQEARLAYLLHQQPSPSPLADAPSARDILRMATVNAGAPTGYGDAIGRLARGSYADAVLIDLERLAEPYLDSDLDLAQALVMLGRGEHVDTVMVGGQVVVEEGRHVSIDEKELHTLLGASVEEQPHLKRVAKHLREGLKHYYKQHYAGVSCNPYYAVNSRAGS